MEALLKEFEAFVRKIVESVIENYDGNEVFHTRVERVIENYDFSDTVERINDNLGYLTNDNELKDAIREVVTEDLTFEVRVQ